jgi:DNA-binding HxlR family transcriptional regulator
VQTALNVLGGRWKPTLLQCMKDGPARYRDFQQQVAQITPQVLSRQLRQLVADGVIYHSPSGSAKASYRLTERGERLAEVMDLLEQWGENYLQWRGFSKQAPRS